MSITHTRPDLPKATLVPSGDSAGLMSVTSFDVNWVGSLPSLDIDQISRPSSSSLLPFEDVKTIVPGGSSPTPGSELGEFDDVADDMSTAPSGSQVNPRPEER
jgi:hypothetical protein